MRIYLIVLLALFAFACGSNPPVSNSNISTNPSPKTPAKPPTYGYQVVNTYKHDPNAFTEGLFFYNGFLYESTGLEGKSDLRKVELETGKVVQKYDLPKASFGEGATLLNGKIYQLTWQEGVCRVFDAETFKLLKEFRYQGDGWGMTNDGTNLIFTDSTYLIRFVNPETFETVRTVPVFRDDGKPLNQINELEYIKGEIWANIWHSEDPDILGRPNTIVRIDPNSGKVLGWINLDGISPDDVNGQGKEENTLNGIAYDPATERVFVTGKNWKKLFEIRLNQ